MPRQNYDTVEILPEHGRLKVLHESTDAYAAYIFYRDYRIRESPGKPPALETVRKEFNKKSRSKATTCSSAKWVDWATKYHWMERYDHYFTEDQQRYDEFRQSALREKASEEVEFARKHFRSISKGSIVTHCRLVAAFDRRITDLGDSAFEDMTPRQIAEIHYKLSVAAKNLADFTAIALGIEAMSEELDITKE